jgi:dienelactone hydrolase
VKWKFVSAFLVSFLILSADGLSAQILEIAPQRIMADESTVIRVTGLQPNERVSIQASLIDGAGANWTAEAEFVADPQGTVDVSKQSPVAGSYKEVSAMGLVWSMMPTDKHVEAYLPPKDLGPQTIKFVLLRNNVKAAEATLVQLNLADGVQQIKVEGQLHGELFLPASKGPFPGVLVLGGSEGGVPRAKAAWLAAHGYAALALAYFRHEGLPEQLQAIPLEYFGKAVGWMMQNRDISPEHIAVMGTSRGGELALQLGSMYPEIKAVIAYVPSNVRRGACCGGTVWTDRGKCCRGRIFGYAWTWHAQPLPFLPFQDRTPQDIMDATIQVEHTHGPILLIAGQNDGIWDSPTMTKAIVGRLKQTHFAYDVERYDYDHAGHRAGRPQIVPSWHSEIRNPVSGNEMEQWGGSAEGDAHSSLDSIPKVLDFLNRHLQNTAPASTAKLHAELSVSK